jgi:hypothetical protein
VGYYSRITGAIAIAPALKWSEYKDKGLTDAGAPNHPSVVLRTHEEERDGEGGVMFVRWADGIIPATDESIKAYELEAEVRAIVAAFRTGRTFGGYLEISGEEQGDLWRLVVRDGRVVRIEPTVTWPEEATS